MVAIDRAFDYAVPDTWVKDGRAAKLRIGSRVRVELNRRRVGGWVVAVDPEPQALATSPELLPLLTLSGLGPSEEMIELGEWAAKRWFGKSVHFLRSASPQANVHSIEPSHIASLSRTPTDWAFSAFDGAGSVLRVGPCQDRWPIVEASLRLGNPLLIVPSTEEAQRLSERLSRAGLRVAHFPEQWAVAASGSAVVGTRAAVWAPSNHLGSVVVFDEHDELLREQRAPTWHAREVAVERARRARVPCVLVSPTPSPEALVTYEVGARSRAEEFAAWSRLEVIDRSVEPPGRYGLFSEALVRALREGPRVACILNRVGRIRLMGCSNCGELTRCEHCDGPMSQFEPTRLRCRRCESERPRVCASCGSTVLKNLVVGIDRAREELSALLGEAVGELTASSADGLDNRVVIGTEALLRRRLAPEQRFRSIAFLDFDQHLMAKRQRGELEAMALLVQACRQVGARSPRSGNDQCSAGSNRVIVQTRVAEHRVLVAASRAEPGPFGLEMVALAKKMGWPPAVTQVELSGAGAEDFVAQLAGRIGVEIVGPLEGKWLVRFGDHEQMRIALGAVQRGASRLRVAVS